MPRRARVGAVAGSVRATRSAPSADATEAVSDSTSVSRSVTRALVVSRSRVVAASWVATSQPDRSASLGRPSRAASDGMAPASIAATPARRASTG